MINEIKNAVWQQFGAAIHTLEQAIEQVPPGLWARDTRFFSQAYHALVFLDYYATLPPEDFSCPLPFNIAEPGAIPEGNIGDVVPERAYTQSELLNYLQASRAKCHSLVDSMDAAKLQERFTEEPGPGAMDYPVLEILLYNMRHVQHHAAQMNLLLRQQAGHAPGWVFRDKDS